MSKYVFIKTANNDAYMNTADNFRGAVHSGDTAVDLYFNAAGSGVAGAFDKVPLVITTQKEQEVMDSIGGALAGTHSKGMIVIADDIANNYVNANISSVGAFSLASTGILAKRNVEEVTADDSITADESGKIFVFTDAAAILTLPDSGAGDIVGTTYTFISYAVQGTGQEVKCADTTGEKMIGSVLIADTDDATTAGSYTSEAGNSYSSFELTGATEGEPGSMWKVTCIDADVWFIEGVVLQGGGSATPFATS